MANPEKRYEKHGSLKPCTLNKGDIGQLAEIIEETYTRPEKERYFRVSTTIGDTRVFFNSIEELVSQPDLPAKLSDLSFWIEGWDQHTRFDKNILLDLSKYSVQLNVEGTDPVWVYDKYARISKFLSDRTSWYWPVIILERYIIFFITILLVTNIVVAFSRRETWYYIDDLGLLGVWIFLVFYDTRKIWPYSDLRIKEPASKLNREIIFMAAMIIIVVAAIMSGTIFPFFK